ncbi:MAG TPA: fumarylacetoacetate hydrolase family protein [Candidatus Acidoferrum sp.]|nr:fumarylacetoacetate hydrolase family protein [Candidatus Acidoferrum sp.]
MKLARFAYENDIHLGLVIQENVFDLGLLDPLDLIGRIKTSELSEYDYLNQYYDLANLPKHKFRDLDTAESVNSRLLMPIIPPEIWACGVTYVRSKTARESETAAKGIYDNVYDAVRPEVFFKGTPHRCVGPNDHVCIRRDSKWTVPEPELVVILGNDRQVLGFTIGSDMTARDIEGENPLYLPQSKIYDASCSLGPMLVTPSSIGNLEDLTIRLIVKRNDSTVFQGETKTGLMKRRIPELLEFLTRDNPVPAGSACMTGTGIVPPDEFALKQDDLVEISIDNVGVLRNPVRQLHE